MECFRRGRTYRRVPDRSARARARITACRPGPAQNLRAQYYSLKVARGEADLIAVAAHADTPGNQFLLSGSGAISGRITDSLTGNPVSGIDVDLYQAVTLLRPGANRYHGRERELSADELARGNLHCARDPPVGMPYIHTYYGGVSTRELATPVPVAVGPPTPNIDIALFTGRGRDRTPCPFAGVFDEQGTTLAASVGAMSPSLGSLLGSLQMTAWPDYDIEQLELAITAEHTISRLETRRRLMGQLRMALVEYVLCHTTYPGHLQLAVDFSNNRTLFAADIAALGSTFTPLLSLSDVFSAMVA